MTNVAAAAKNVAKTNSKYAAINDKHGAKCPIAAISPCKSDRA
jgi:hypothetical protein